MGYQFRGPRRSGCRWRVGSHIGRDADNPVGDVLSGAVGTDREGFEYVDVDPSVDCGKNVKLLPLGKEK